ncbi:MAG: N-acetylglucosamine-6-phosphate deacetylase [Sulfitobacter sp.]
MTAQYTALIGADIFDGVTLHSDAVLLRRADGVVAIVGEGDLPQDCELHRIGGGVITPGFVDLQVNGGGGVMFNDAQTVETLQVMAEAHATTGTTALLPTLITDTAERTQAAIAAVVRAIDEKLPGIIGIHLEGPHLSVARKGAHDPGLIRAMTDADMTVFLDAADRLANVMLTVAPENVRDDQIAELAKAGVIVSLGHTDASYDRCMAAFDAGARCATHLFNAMSQLGSREPGLVGAALAHPAVSAGLIADAVHVHPATMQMALTAKSAVGKQGPGRVFLVTDAMATGGCDIEEFTLNGRIVRRENGRLTLDDGTLAGADLEFGRAISVLVDQVGLSVQDALGMATSVPADLLRDDMGAGRISAWDNGIIHLDQTTWKPRHIASLLG